MKKNIYLFLFCIIGIFSVRAQTVATDFTVNDCGGTSRHLFAELDAGKVIVMAMVDPCGSCISPSVNANNIAKSYATSNPGRVVFWLTDDFGNTNCATLTSWANTYGLSGVVTLTSASITQNNYGGAAMPKILVLAGSDHKIYFKQDNGLNNANLTTAINAALAATGIDEKRANLQLSVFPNPAVDRISVGYNLTQTSEVSFEVYNLLGTKVKTVVIGRQSSGDQKIALDFETISNGVYFLKLIAGEYSQIIKFTVAR